MHLFESPPDTLHVLAVHSLVVILEINPAAKATNHILPLLGEAHDDLSAPLVVLGDTDGLTFLRVSNLVGLVDLELDWETVTVPTKATFNVVASHGGVASHNILQSQV